MKLDSEPTRLAGYLGIALLFATACGGSTQAPSSNQAGTAGATSAASGGSLSSGGTNGGAANANAGTSATAGSAVAGNLGSDNGKTPCYGGCATHPERPAPSAPPACPTSEPAAGAACDRDALRCGYGDSRAVQCRRLYECLNGAWQADVSISQRYSCDPLPTDYCPTTPQHEQPCVIANVGMPCTYGELSCICFASSPMPGKPGNWLCYGPPANPQCPATAPNLGDGCSSNGLGCNYDADACNAAPTSSLFCFDGAWEQGEGYNCAI
ncbi:MAG TPA: hypothetical protein VHM25_14500 [Polyangiaceae bacterium]|jgi:hypothetical protein|nr:hypothetical protein [Polyangiaceae bacterium]